MTWRILRAIAHSIIVHTRVLDEYIHFPLMYMTHNTFTVLPIKYLLNHYVEPNTPHKLVTSKKPSVYNLHVLFLPCVLQKATAHVDGKALNMHHQSPKGFGVSPLEFHNFKNGTSSMYLVHVKYFLHMTFYLMKHLLFHSLYFMSIFKVTCDANRGIVNSIRYIFP